MREQLVAHYGPSESAPLLRALAELSAPQRIGAEANHVSRKVPGATLARIGVEIDELKTDAIKEVDALPWKDVVERVDEMETRGRHRGMFELMDSVLRTIADARAVAAEMGDAIRRVLGFIQALFARVVPQSVTYVLGEIGGFFARMAAAASDVVTRLVYDFVNGIRRALASVFLRMHLALMSGLQLVYDKYESIRESVDLHCFFALGMYHERGEAAMRGNVEVEGEWRRTMSGQLRNIADDAANLNPDLKPADWSSFAPMVVDTARVLGTSLVKWLFSKAAFFVAYVVEHMESAAALIYEVFACMTPLAFLAFKPLISLLKENPKPDFERQMNELYELPYFQIMLPLAPGATPAQLLYSLDAIRSSADAPEQAKHIATTGYRILRQASQAMDTWAQMNNGPPPALNAYEASTKQMEMARLMRRLSVAATEKQEFDEQLTNEILAFAKRYGSRQIERGRMIRLMEEATTVARQCFSDAYDIILASVLGLDKTTEKIGKHATPWKVVEYEDAEIYEVRARFPGVDKPNGPTTEDRAEWPESSEEVFEARARLQTQFNKLMKQLRDIISENAVKETKQGEEAIEAIQTITHRKLLAIDSAIQATGRPLTKANEAALIASLSDTVQQEEVRRTVILYSQAGAAEVMIKLQKVLSKLIILTAASDILSARYETSKWVVRNIIFLIFAGAACYAYYLTQCDWSADPAAAAVAAAAAAANATATEAAAAASNTTATWGDAISNPFINLGSAFMSWIRRAPDLAAAAANATDTVAGEGASSLLSYYSPTRNFMSEFRPWTLLKDMIHLGAAGTLAGRQILANMSYVILSNLMLQVQFLATAFVSVWMTANLTTYGVLHVVGYNRANFDSYEAHIMRSRNLVYKQTWQSIQLTVFTFAHNLAQLWAGMLARDQTAVGIASAPLLLAYRSFAPNILQGAISSIGGGIAGAISGISAGAGVATAASSANANAPGLHMIILDKIKPQPWVRPSDLTLKHYEFENLDMLKVRDVTNVLSNVAKLQWNPNIRAYAEGSEYAKKYMALEQTSKKIYEKSYAMLQFVIFPDHRREIAAEGVLALPSPVAIPRYVAPKPPLALEPSKPSRVEEVDDQPQTVRALDTRFTPPPEAPRTTFPATVPAKDEPRPPAARVVGSAKEIELVEEDGSIIRVPADSNGNPILAGWEHRRFKNGYDYFKKNTTGEIKTLKRQ